MNGFLITVRGEATTLDLGALGPRDSTVFRKATGMGLNDALSQAAEFDVVCGLWWLARVKAGEAFFTYEQALDAFPTYGELLKDPEVLTLTELEEVEETDPDSPLE